MNLFVTWDKIGSETGGGTVTANELQALKELGDDVHIINPPITNNPFDADEIALKEYQKLKVKPRLAHFYSNTYPKLIKALKKDGAKITYTIAAHHVEDSMAEHKVMGFDFNFPHLTDPKIFKKYLAPYRLADVVICPSEYSKRIVKKFGCKSVEVIPHGIHYPQTIKPAVDFSVGYLGSPGPDKGLTYLIQAWSMLNYPDALLTIAGRNSELLLPFVRQGKGNIHLAGFVEDISTFYNSCTVYVQPSVTEGFGIEILEAMSYGKAVIASEGAGGSECVRNEVNGFHVPIRAPKAIADFINYYKENPQLAQEHGAAGREIAKDYTWDIIRKKYIGVWKNVYTTVR